MPSLNRVVLMGHLTRDPELRYTPNGTAVCDIGLAINEKYKSGEDWKTKTIFVDCVAWARQAETCGEYLHKGDLVLIEGGLEYEQWEKDGKKRSKIKVRVQHATFMPRGDRGDASSDSEPELEPEHDSAEATPKTATAAPRMDEDNLPF